MTKRGVSKLDENLVPFINRVHEDDCLNLLPKLPSESIDMILCDLPYGITQNSWDSVVPLDKLWGEYKRIIKPNGVIVLTAAGVFTARLILSCEEMFKYKWVWVKSKASNFLNAKKQPLRKHEDVLVFYNQPPTYNPQMTEGLPYYKGMVDHTVKDSGSYGSQVDTLGKSEDGKRYPVDVISFKTAESEPYGAVMHSTQKPVDLGRYFVRTYTNPGDVVLDNCCGSGSFILSAMLEGRNFIGIELNKGVTLYKSNPLNLIALCKARILREWETMEDELKQSFVVSPVKNIKRRKKKEGGDKSDS